MTEERKVYLVTSGNYSDYGVDAVFSTREMAEAAVAIANARRRAAAEIQDSKLWPDDLYDIEEKLLDVWPTSEGGAFEVWITDGGAVTYAAWTHSYEPDMPARIGNDHLVGRPSTFIGYGETAEHARRSAEELRRVTITTPAMQEGE
jgi:hypothetical protein